MGSAWGSAVDRIELRDRSSSAACITRHDDGIQAVKHPVSPVGATSYDLPAVVDADRGSQRDVRYQTVEVHHHTVGIQERGGKDVVIVPVKVVYSSDDLTPTVDSICVRRQAATEVPQISNFPVLPNHCVVVPSVS